MGSKKGASVLWHYELSLHQLGSRPPVFIPRWTTHPCLLSYKSLKPAQKQSSFLQSNISKYLLSVDMLFLQTTTMCFEITISFKKYSMPVTPYKTLRRQGHHTIPIKPLPLNLHPSPPPPKKNQKTDRWVLITSIMITSFIRGKERS